MQPPLPPAMPLLRAASPDDPVFTDLQAFARGLETFRTLLSTSLVIPLMWGVAGLSVGPGTSAFYLGPSQGGASEADAQVAAPRRLLLADLTVRVTPAPGASQSYTFTLRVNGADSALVSVVGGSSQGGITNTAEVLVEPGDLVTIRLATSAGAATLTSVRFGLNVGLHIL